jgi:hypothetical protein
MGNDVALRPVFCTTYNKDLKFHAISECVSSAVSGNGVTVVEFSSA